MAQLAVTEFEFLEIQGQVVSPLENELYNLLNKFGPMTRSELVKQVQEPRTTVYDNLTRLQDKGFVRKFTRPTNFRGRPLVFFKLVD